MSAFLSANCKALPPLDSHQIQLLLSDLRVASGKHQLVNEGISKAYGSIIKMPVSQDAACQVLFQLFNAPIDITDQDVVTLISALHAVLTTSSESPALSSAGAGIICQELPIIVQMLWHYQQWFARTNLGYPALQREPIDTISMLNQVAEIIEVSLLFTKDRLSEDKYKQLIHMLRRAGAVGILLCSIPGTPCMRSFLASYALLCAEIDDLQAHAAAKLFMLADSSDIVQGVSHQLITYASVHLESSSDTAFSTLCHLIMVASCVPAMIPELATPSFITSIIRGLWARMRSSQCVDVWPRWCSDVLLDVVHLTTKLAPEDKAAYCAFLVEDLNVISLVAKSLYGGGRFIDYLK
ncbi:hypothetical protein FRC02_005068 [Tulasnella sp. 418]|nr:hypothetical protein FRC02_005068 [Tulasnella sp. 418]